jgi:hypothetical protein
MERFLGVDAGPFKLALPLAAVRQILDVGAGEAALDPRALGVTPYSLAELLGEQRKSSRPALLLFDSILGTSDPVVLTCCLLRGVIDSPTPKPLPLTVACRWPGLLRGTIDDGGSGLILVLDASVLMGLLEART